MGRVIQSIAIFTLFVIHSIFAQVNIKTGGSGYSIGAINISSVADRTALMSRLNFKFSFTITDTGKPTATPTGGHRHVHAVFVSSILFMVEHPISALEVDCCTN